ncbi:hypothetical protein ACIPVB_08860 [Microbacterium sp. NPDC090007]|uniref:hypothetical protein n=1 Tax=Microbacterium sp. NPDC090007 TaxID=3364204 RepID=UPI0037F552F7
MSTPGVPPQQPQIVYQQILRPPSNGAAVAAVIVGSLALFFGLSVPIPLLGLFSAALATPLAIGAVALGHVGISKSRRSGVGRTPALLGLIFGYATIAIVALTTIVVIISTVVSAGQR